MLTAPDFAQAVTAARETGTREHFFEFEKAFGKDPLGGPAALKKRQDSGETGRFRKFAREWLAERDDSLDISWLKDDNAESSADLPEPAILATSAMEEMEAIMEDLRGILAELGEEIEEVAERMANGDMRARGTSRSRGATATPGLRAQARKWRKSFSMRNSALTTRRPRTSFPHDIPVSQFAARINSPGGTARCSPYFFKP